MSRKSGSGKVRIDPTLVDRTVEPRLAQIFVPLLSVVEDEEARESLRALRHEYHRELIADRGLDIEGESSGGHPGDRLAR